ncbi:ABC transporter ATP-binding protein [Alkalihalobacillus sp. LMS39]|uniref:ABC transporter ATP-binding protein n=1 Tax=Alkalihalobacillus sp. LMS39 TaxID=2924032 RepID=UPI001FB45DAD|nr:ABC transporter ATP-binding protein [Alkalihalobacillus sp. LMS39]UOE94585.1 ABC transporter ATP-binding protein [Alkalihalobacillus sp. LMS39]
MSAIYTKEVATHVGAFSLRDISVSFEEGKITGIIGPNGSGKSTLLKVLTRLLSADKGEVWLNEKNLHEFKAREFATALAMLPQSKGVLPNLTVKELITYGRSPHQQFFTYRLSTDDKIAIEWAMEVTGTSKHANRMFHTLSGGEQQKARIAMALAQQTNLLLLDEPTTYLDISHQLDVMETLETINENYHMTIIMVLHDLQQAAKYCHHLITMKRGSVVATGHPQEIITAQFLQDVYGIEAKVQFEDGYPIVIPIKTLKKGRNS